MRRAGGGEIKGLQTILMPSAGQMGSGDSTSVLGGPCHAATIDHLLSASLSLLSCPSCPSCPCPLCPGATLPTPGGSGGSVNGYHTCKGELTVSTTEPSPCPFFVHAFPFPGDTNLSVTPSASQEKGNELGNGLGIPSCCDGGWRSG